MKVIADCMEGTVLTEMVRDRCSLENESSSAGEMRAEGGMC